MALHGVESCAEFFEVLGQTGQVKAWSAAHPMDWTVEQEGGRAIEDVLSKLVSLIVHRLDVDENGVVEAKDFALHMKTGPSPS